MVESSANEVHRSQGPIETPNSVCEDGEMHVASTLYLSRFDFATRKDAPTSELMVAGIPRSGSTAFCLELWRTGVLGAPLEYANFNILKGVARWQANDKSKYWKELQAVRTSANGVFAYKFFVRNYIEIAHSAPDLLPFIAPTHVVYLTREDTLAQAISYSRAIRSGAWFAGGKNEPVNVDFDMPHIRQCYQSIGKQMRSWERVFALTGASVLRVTYEEMMRDSRDTVGRVVQHVFGRAVELDPVHIPAIEVQRDRVSENWQRMLSAEEDEWRRLEAESSEADSTVADSSNQTGFESSIKAAGARN